MFYYVFGPTAASRCFQDLQVRTRHAKHRPLLLAGAYDSHPPASVHLPLRKKMIYKHLIMPVVVKATWMMFMPCEHPQATTD